MRQATGSKAAVLALIDKALQVGWPECGYKPGQRPAIGETALHQVPFIFHNILAPLWAVPSHAKLFGAVHRVSWYLALPTCGQLWPGEHGRVPLR